MNNRQQGRPQIRQAATPIHRGPQAASAPSYPGAAYPMHAPNAALLIDFDNVTMGIRSDLGNELRNLLGSDIIKGKVAVQRAYADWRRYPQYIVPLTEASIDLIFAPAYGSSKKNATDIRLAIDAMELVFTRPEIGTIILLSGDSDFSSLVIKLKEYGKYIIGVGIRESSSDLLVMNCDEYYSYNALAGLVKSSDDEAVRKDPWELVAEALGKMKRNGDVMRSDRLKQVMQELDSSFDEKDLGHPKFSRFVQEAATRGLLKLTKLENGQLEVGLPDEAAGATPKTDAAAPPAREGREREERGRSRRGGRGRDREREPRREGRTPAAATAETPAEPDAAAAETTAAPPAAAAPPVPADMPGERLTRDEAFDLVRRAVQQRTNGDPEASVRASDVRSTAREILGRDSESLAERYFQRILRDAHDNNVIDLRKRGDDYEVSIAAAAAPIADQLKEAAGEAGAIEAAGGIDSQASRSAAAAQSLRRGIRGRGASGRGGAAVPPELLMLGVIDDGTQAPAAAASQEQPEAEAPAAEAAPAAAKKRGRRRGGAKKAAATSSSEDATAAPAAKKTAKRGKRAPKKTTKADDGAAAGKASTGDAPTDEGGAAAKKTARKRRGRGRKTATASTKE
jgi:uncharacterized protein (TIGR00288 family)